MENQKDPNIVSESPVVAPQEAAAIQAPAAEQGGAEPLAAEPQTIAPAQSAYDPLAVVSEFTGGAIRNSQDWETFQAARVRASELEAKTLDLESKLGQYTPLSSKVNEMLLAGKDLQEVKKFIEVQSIDPNTMSDLDAIKTKYALDYPSLTPDQIEAFLEENGLLSFNEVSSPGMIAKQTIQGREAKAHLNAMKVATIAPASNAANEAKASQEAQYRQNIERWNAIPKPSVMKESIQVDGYTTEIQLSAEAIAAGHAAAMAWVQSTGAPLDATNKKTFEDVARHLAIAHDSQDMLKFVAADAFAKGVLSTKQALGGAPPAPIPTGTKPEAVKQNGAIRFSS